LGAYSDVATLYFRDHLWRHPVPYVDYPFEYPVGIGFLTWLVGFVDVGLAPYLLATGAVMLVSGLLTLWVGRTFASANLWLLALSPALVLYVLLNWDMFAVFLTVTALALLHHRRDGWGA